MHVIASQAGVPCSGGTSESFLDLLDWVQVL